MEGIRKLFGILKVPFYAIIEVGIAGVFLGVLSALLHNFDILDGDSFWEPYVYGAYMAIVLIIIVKNAIHRSKWYVRRNPIKVRCPQCHTIVPLTRYREERYLRDPLALYLPRGIRFFHLRSDKIPLFEILYRPYLQLVCPECGEKQLICPYCHEPIQEDQVECKYDKPSVCPHCGKYIYTPLPLQDCEGLTKVKDIAE